MRGDRGTDPAVTTWRALLDDYEALLNEVERRLAADDWDLSVPPLLSLPAPLLVPTPAEQARLQHLLARGEGCGQRLAEEMGETRDDLGQLSRRHDAAALYTSG